MDAKKLEARARHTYACNLRSKSQSWIEANTARYKDPSYSKKVGKSISKTYSTDEMREIQAKKAQGQNSIEHNENIRKARLIAPPRSESTKKKISSAQVGNNKRARPVEIPQGIFVSLKEAGLFYNNFKKFNNGASFIRDKIKRGIEGFRYLTKEEYKDLTGKDI